MKAVIYHANTDMNSVFPTFEVDKIYRNLVADLKINLKQFNMELIHLTVEGHEGWGDTNYFYAGECKNVVYNRELFTRQFLSQQSNNETFLFLEPDSRIVKPVPDLPEDVDLALLRRNDGVAITSSWKLARSTSIKWFDMVLENFPSDLKHWNGDSAAYIKMWQLMGKPGLIQKKSKIFTFLNMKIQLRDYNLYSTQTSPIMRQWKGTNKLKLL